MNYVVMVLRVVALCLMIGIPKVVSAEGGWNLSAFAGSTVTTVAVHPTIKSELAVAVNKHLELSHDGGITWRDGNFEGNVNAISYDPLKLGFIYVATDRGAYLTDDSGITWRLLDTSLTPFKIITAITATDHAVMALGFNGSGTPTVAYRMQPGMPAVATTLPEENLSGLTYDSSTHQLYVGGNNGMYVSDDEGDHWRALGAGSGRFTYAISADGPLIWQTSAEGIARSLDQGATWQHVADANQLNGTRYTSDMRPSGGILVNHGQALFGLWSPFYNVRVLARSDGETAQSIFDGHINAMGDATSRMWIATDNGLWVNDSLITAQQHIRRPVVVIPGILGSMPTLDDANTALDSLIHGKWDDASDQLLSLDPVHHTYDDLLTTLEQGGYQLNVNLFPFPYNWTQSNETSAGQLADKIKSIRLACSCSEIDIVAHSMGGLIARSYIESSQYPDDVHTLVLLSVPNAGSARAYAAWEAGRYEGLGTNNQDRFLNLFSTVLAQDKTAGVKAEAVRRFMPSLGQLLPDRDYINGRHYPSGYPRNSFLEALNTTLGIKKLTDDASVYEIGSKRYPTMDTLDVGEPNPGYAAWPDGAQLSSSNSEGDNTVTLKSVASASKISRLFSSDHGSIVSESADYVLSILLGEGESAPKAKTAVLKKSTVAVVGSRNTAITVKSTKGAVVSTSKKTAAKSYSSGTKTSVRAVTLPLEDLYPVTIEVTRDPGQNPDSKQPIVVGVTTLPSEDDTNNDSTNNEDAKNDPTTQTSNPAPGQTETYQYDPITEKLIPISESISGPSPVTPANASASKSAEWYVGMPRLATISSLLQAPHEAMGGALPNTRSTVHTRRGLHSVMRGITQLPTRPWVRLILIISGILNLCWIIVIVVIIRRKRDE